MDVSWNPETMRGVHKVDSFALSREYHVVECLHYRLSLRGSISSVLRSLSVAILLWLRCRSLERLLEVGDDVVDVFCAHRDADEVLFKWSVLLSFVR